MRAPVLGLGGSNHDFSAAIVDAGAIAIAIEDERVQRVKHGRTEWHSHPARDAATYCLQAMELELEEMAGVFCSDDLERPTDWIDWERVVLVNHHEAHAAASFFSSPHEKAALLVIDGHGSPLDETTERYEVETISIGSAENISLRLDPLQTGRQRKTSSSWRYVADNSIGWFYEIVTTALGFGDTGVGKTMGLAAYGQPGLLRPLREFVEIGPEGHFRFAPYAGIFDWLTTTLASSANAFQVRADIAYAAQEILVDAVVAAAEEAYRQHPARALCFGGGCALNTLANSSILERTPFEELFVFPAAGDNGLAAGAALYGAHTVLKQPRQPSKPGWRGRVVYTGREFSLDEADDALKNASVAVLNPNEPTVETARALVRGETVAICRGRSEIGPRALGNRSILALPAPVAMRDHVNLTIKHRESFRPLAPVVPIEHVSTYFEGLAESPYMLLVATVRPEAREKLAAVTHVDGTARVQTVREEDNPFLHRLLCLVGDATGVPVLMNTSLNLRGEPIVETPADAVDLFVRCPLDVLVVGDRIVRKYTPWVTPAALRAVSPSLRPGG
jgi:carbamoyltransferase